MAETLAQRGLLVESMSDGIAVHEVLSLPELHHQTDAAIRCAKAYIIGEWRPMSAQCLYRAS
jgi:hypothetical protein